MSDFQVMVLGVGDTFSQLHHPSALILSCAGHLLAIDCPDMYRKVLWEFSQKSELSLDIPDIQDFLITHVHGDHMNGLEGVAFFNRFALQKRTRVFGTPEVTNALWDGRLAASMGTIWDGKNHQTMKAQDYFELHELNWQEPNTIGPFTIQLKRTIHHLPTCALLVEAQGRTVGYSGDTAFDPSLIQFLKPADLIIHETNLGPAHSSSDALFELPRALRDRMRLIHYSDTFATESSSIKILQQGQILTI